ncbi:hypothetical protein BJY16_006336 [Actinoplanes octamycinicus]|uniref:L-2-amino-thiazoline-4-carboxylic acid hydrolase-like protein n=1 Tax=Actinoplanes octamycinicus TaxID=135948 RepID=A0A7W7MAD7_9ACTN|nr:L-2-amino-thiazoline-4-carboxylic acid hydrolase [Actinoplanes octamycinicus]MBB4742877.1 hypothetical protein [Actinoplanes octamycinicus]GIE58270.1 hypothetical protein Aoc01nite_36720 [Actinoplanes octamycinicus]
MSSLTSSPAGSADDGSGRSVADGAGDAPGWVRDPDADSRAVVAAFFDRLADDLAARGVAAGVCVDLLGGIQVRSGRLSGDSPVPASDAPARYNRRYTAAVLAAYEVLSAAGADGTPGIPAGAELTGLLTAAFVEPLGEQVASGTRAMLDAAADPFAAMVAVARQRETDDFGAEFEFSHPVDDEHQFVAKVHRCGYHEYFRAHGTPQLTPVLCAFDANWISAIAPERHGFTFARPATIGHGAASCPFDFRRTAVVEPSVDRAADAGTGVA